MRTVFVDIRTASRESMEMVFQQYREKICRELHQIKTDLDSYNDNFNKGEPLVFVFDFSDDVAEMMAGQGPKPRRP